MATPVTMPKMGAEMAEGSIQNWLKKEGDKVSKGEIIAEIETDKSTVEMEAFSSGVLRKIVVQPGNLVPVGTVIAVIGEENEEIDWKAMGVDGPGGNVAQLAAKTDSPSDTGAARKSAGEGGEALSPDVSITLKEIQEAAPVAQRIAEGKASYGSEGKVPASGAGSSTFSRKAASNIINLAAPQAAASGPGGSAVPAETVGELKLAGQAVPVQGAAVNATAQPVAAPAISNGNGSQPRGENGRVKSSPLARKVAEELGVDVAAVSGSGPGGRIVRADVEQYAKLAPTPVVTPAIAPPMPLVAPQVQTESVQMVADPVPVSGADYSEQSISRMRQTIARRMTESKQQVPHFYVSNEVDMSEALKLRQTLNQANEGGPKISVNDMVLKAVAKALRKYPALNNAYVDGKIRVNNRVNVAVAVALADGLITPVVFDVDQKSIGQVAAEARTLAEKARTGSLRPEEFQGGTFTVSNLGMFDVSSFVAIINPPQAAILAVGSTKPVVVVKSGSPEDGTAVFGVSQQMTLTISADHRATDGAVAAQFLVELKRLLQNPLLLLV